MSGHQRHGWSAHVIHTHLPIIQLDTRPVNSLTFDNLVSKITITNRSKVTPYI